MASSSSSSSVNYVHTLTLPMFFKSSKHFRERRLTNAGCAPFRMEDKVLYSNGYQCVCKLYGCELTGETRNEELALGSDGHVVVRYQFILKLNADVTVESGFSEHFTPGQALTTLAHKLSEYPPELLGEVNLAAFPKLSGRQLMGLQSEDMQEALKLIHPSQFSTDEVAAASSAFQAAEAAKEPEHARKRASFAPAAKQVAAAPDFSVEALANATVAKDSAGAVPLSDNDLSVTPEFAAFELSLSGLPLPSDGVYSTPIAEEHFAADPGQAASQLPLSGDEFIEDRGDIFANVEPIAVNDVEFGGA